MIQLPSFLFAVSFFSRFQLLALPFSHSTINSQVYYFSLSRTVSRESYVISQTRSWTETEIKLFVCFQRLHKREIFGKILVCLKGMNFIFLCIFEISILYYPFERNKSAYFVVSALLSDQKFIQIAELLMVC